MFGNYYLLNLVFFSLLQTFLGFSVASEVSVACLHKFVGLEMTKDVVKTKYIFGHYMLL